MPEPAEARLEPVLLHELHAPRVVELVNGGMSLNRVSAALGITWLTAKEALDYARAAGVSSGPVPSSIAVPSEEEEAHRPLHATEAARLKDEEKMSFAEIGAKLGISESTARRTYDWARREKMVAAAGASRAPVPDRVKLAPRAAL